MAAGRSARLGGTLLKQFAPLGEGTVLERAVRALSLDPRIEALCVVLPPEEVEGAQGALKVFLRYDAANRGVIRGVRRVSKPSRRVYVGKDEIPRVRHVLVHDAARPLCPARVVRDVVDATLADGAAVPVLSVHDTVKEDDGEGFAAGEETRIFEPFYRRARAATGDGPSVGLGLTLVRRIAEAHGGVAYARNREPRGAMVVVELHSAAE